jgi:hypothetical protein
MIVNVLSIHGCDGPNHAALLVKVSLLYAVLNVNVVLGVLVVILVEILQVVPDLGVLLDELPDLAGHLDPVHLGHVDVCQDQGVQLRTVELVDLLHPQLNLVYCFLP